MKKMMLLWIFILSINPSYSQQDQTIEVNDDFKKWAVVKLTIAYMEDCYSFTPTEKGKNGSDKEYNTYIILHRKYDKFKPSIDLGKVEDLLSNGGWTKTKEDVFKPYKKEIVENSIDDFKNIEFIPPTSKNDNTSSITIARNKTLQEIQSKYESYQKSAVGFNQSNSETSITDEKHKDDHIEHMQRSQNSLIGLLKPLLILILIVSLIGIIIYMRKLKSKAKDRKIEAEVNKGDNTNQSKEQNNNSGDNKTIKELQKESDQQKRDIENYKSKIKELQDEIKQLKGENDKNNVERVVVPLVEVEQPTKNRNEHITTTIYFSSPLKELVFANENANTEVSDNIYKVVYNEDNKIGTLSIIEGADLTRSLSTPQFYLEPVCSYENLYNSSARGIKVIEDGKIKLVGDDWIVNKKVLIKFLY